MWSAWSIRYAGCCALIYSTDLSPQSANRVFPSISLDRNIFSAPLLISPTGAWLSRAATLQLEMRFVPEQSDPARPALLHHSASVTKTLLQSSLCRALPSHQPAHTNICLSRRRTAQRSNYNAGAQSRAAATQCDETQYKICLSRPLCRLLA